MLGDGLGEGGWEEAQGLSGLQTPSSSSPAALPPSSFRTELQRYPSAHTAVHLPIQPGTELGNGYSECPGPGSTVEMMKEESTAEVGDPIATSAVFSTPGKAALRLWEVPAGIHRQRAWV